MDLPNYNLADHFAFLMLNHHMPRSIKNGIDEANDAATFYHRGLAVFRTVRDQLNPRV
jgi:hypothetical protein